MKRGEDGDNTLSSPLCFYDCHHLFKFHDEIKRNDEEHEENMEMKEEGGKAKDGNRLKVTYVGQSPPSTHLLYDW